MESPKHPSPKSTETLDLHPFEHSDHLFHSTSALQILRETVRILRYNLTGFISITAVLICPVSALQLSNILVNQSLVIRLTIRLLLLAKSSGFPITPLVENSLRKFSEIAVSTVMCFPLFFTLLLISKTAVVYSVNSTYSRKVFDSSKCYLVIQKIWKRIVVTYLLNCAVITGCLSLVLASFFCASSVLFAIGLSPDLIMCAVVLLGFFLSVFFANAVIICDLAMVMSVLENVCGFEALLRARVLIRGQMQVGLVIFVGSGFGMAFIEGLFEYRVRSLSYGDGASRIWEGPLLVGMYSFVVLVEFMMSAVWYFSCKACGLENGASVECGVVLETAVVSPVVDSDVR